MIEGDRFPRPTDLSRPEEGEKKEKETKQFELGLFEFESRIIRKDNFSIEKKKEREKKKNGLESR